MTPQTALGYEATAGVKRAKTLFEAATVAEIKQRLARLQSDSQRQWGKMNAAQTLAHCSAGMGMAMSKENYPRIFISRILGPLVKKSLIVNGTPMRRNSPTHPSLIVADERDLAAEKQRLSECIDRFAAGGPAAFITHSHPFFGPLTSVEWSSLMYQHLDHHFRQFGA